MSFQVIDFAVLSEKAYKQMEKGIYTFMVDKRSAKNQIKEAVEKQFSVKVEKINIIAKAAKTKRISKSRKTVLVGGGKKAIVSLAAGQTISMLSPKAEKKEKTSKEKKSAKVSKVSNGPDGKPKGKGFLSKITRSKETKKEDK